MKTYSMSTSGSDTANSTPKTVEEQATCHAGGNSVVSGSDCGGERGDNHSHSHSQLAQRYLYVLPEDIFNSSDDDSDDVVDADEDYSPAAAVEQSFT